MTTGFVFFVAVLVGTLAITYSAAKRTTNAKLFYAAGSELSGVQNGLAMAGDYMSAASFLGITGAIATAGFDGFYYSVGFLVSYLVLLYIVAEPLRNLGTYTLADAIAVRFESPYLRGTIAVCGVIVTLFYLVAQLVGAGTLIHVLLPISVPSAIALSGVLMTVYVAFGGMLATSWLQIVKAILLVGTTFLLSLMILSRFGWNVFELFGQASNRSPLGSVLLEPGNGFRHPLDSLSLMLSLLLGTAGLPHILVRLFTVKNAGVARESVSVATKTIAPFYFMTALLGLGAAALIDPGMLQAGDGANMAVPLLAEKLGGEFLMSFVSAVAFATILAVVSGLLLSASSAFAHDVYAQLVRKGRATDREQMRAAKLAAIAVGLLSVIVALFMERWNVAFLVALTFAVAASVNVPIIVLTLFWKKCNASGAIIGMLTGLISSLALVCTGPDVMNADTGLIRHEAWFPLRTPGLVSIPLAFAGCVIGSLLTRKTTGEEQYTAMLLRSQTGIKS